MSRIGAARDVRADARRRPAVTGEAGSTGDRAARRRPQRDLLRAGQAVDHVAARRAGPATLGHDQPDGLDRQRGRRLVVVPTGTPVGSLPDRRPGHEPGPHRDGRPCRSTSSRTIPTAAARRVTSLVTGVTMGRTHAQDRVSWPAGHRSVQRDRRLRGPAQHRTAARGAPPSATPGRRSAATYTLDFDTSTGSASGPSTRPATGARGSQAARPSRVHPFDDRSASVVRTRQLDDRHRARPRTRRR